MTYSARNIEAVALFKWMDKTVAREDKNSLGWFMAVVGFLSFQPMYFDFIDGNERHDGDLLHPE